MSTEEQWEAACDALIAQGYEAIDGVLMPSKYDFFDRWFAPYPAGHEDYPICPICGDDSSIWTVQFKRGADEEMWLKRCDHCGEIIKDGINS